MTEKNMKTLTIRGTTYEIVDEKSRTNTPDWNQNDPTSMTYVQNRPFYSTDPVETTIVEEQTLEGFSEGTYQINATNIELIEGQTYDVVWDGTTYSDLVCYIVEGFNAIGAHFKKNSGFDFTTCPFVIIYISSYQALMIQTDSTETSHTIKIISAISEVIQLPEKYISYKPGIKTTGTIYAITAKDQDTGENVKTEVVAGIGAEIFNDYVSNIASGDYSHAEGDGTTASGISSHAEGDGTTASGYYSHAEGDGTTASGISSHAEGAGTVASHCYAHAEGVDTKATGWAAHAEGYRTVAAGRCQHVQGEFNIKDTENRYVHIVGNGGDNGKDYSNAHTLDWDGNAWFAGKVFVGGTSQDDENAKTLATTPDWNENDENDLAYILNRTHYDSTDWTLIESDTYKSEVQPESDHKHTAYLFIYLKNEITENSNLKVIYDGSEYYLSYNKIFNIKSETTNTNLAYTYTGNNELMYKALNSTIIKQLNDAFEQAGITNDLVIESDSNTDTDIPFCISENTIITMDTEQTTHDISIYQLSEGEIVKLDKKYLPEEALVNADWEQNSPFTNDYIKNKPFYSKYNESIVHTINRGVECTETASQSGVYYGSITHTEDINAGTICNISCNLPTDTDIIYYDLVWYENTNINGTVLYCIGEFDNEKNEMVFDKYPFYLTYNPNDLVINLYTKNPGTYSLQVYEKIITEEIKKIDPKFLPDGIGTQSDWNVNDENDPAFVKNRPFYTTDPQPFAIVDGTYTFVDLMDTGVTLAELSSFDIETISEGQEVKVTWDGTEYNCTCKFHEEGIQFIGNGAILNPLYGEIFGITFEDSGEPFVIIRDGILTLDTTNTKHAVIITTNKVLDITIPHKYLGLNIWNGEALNSTIIGSEENIASAKYSLSEGLETNASGQASHAEGYGSDATGQASHAEGNWTTASGDFSHAEGSNTKASGEASHAEGYGSNANSDRSHAEGFNTLTTEGWAAHAEGISTIATGTASHAEGHSTVASGKCSHAEGSGGSNLKISLTGEAEAITFTVEGDLDALYEPLLINATTSGYAGHSVRIIQCTKVDNKITEIKVDGLLSKTAISNKSYNFTLKSIAVGKASHVEGLANLALSDYQHVQGKYNALDAYNKYAHIVGNGTSDTKRSNAHTLAWDGTAEYQGDVIANACGGENPISLVETAAKTVMHVQVTQQYSNDGITYSSDKTFSEISEHVNSGGSILLFYNDGVNGNPVYQLDTLNSNQAVFKRIYSNPNNISVYYLYINNDDSISTEFESIRNLQLIDLNTTDKTLVGAINELLATITDLQADIETLKNNQATYDEETENLTIGG